MTSEAQLQRRRKSDMQWVMKARVSILLGVLGLSLATFTSTAAGTDKLDPGASPAKDALFMGFNRAKADSRNVFILYGFKACPPCRMFEKYLAIPEVQQIFERHFVLVKIDTVAMPDGEALQNKYGPLGAPAWAILNPAGKVLADSDDGSGNVGYPSAERGRTQFVNALKTATPSLSRSELVRLIASLGDSTNANTSAAASDIATGEPAAAGKLDPSGDTGLRTLSLLNSPEGVQSSRNQLPQLGIRMFLSAQQALVGTWTNKDLKVEIFLEGTPPEARVRLPAGVARLHLLWNVDSTIATASAFAVTRSPSETEAFTFKLIGGSLHAQKVVIFTDRSGRPNQIGDIELTKMQ